MLINTWILRSFLSFSLISLIKKLLSSDIQYLVVQISSWKHLGSSNFNIFLNLWGHEKEPSVRRLIPCCVFALSFLDSENKWLNIRKEEVGEKKDMVQKEEGEGPSWRKHLEVGGGLGDGGGEWRWVTEDAQGPRLVASVTGDSEQRHSLDQHNFLPEHHGPAVASLHGRGVETCWAWHWRVEWVS